MRNLVIRIPFPIKFFQEFFHEPVSFCCHFFTGFCVHPVFQKQEFFIKVIDRRCGGILIIFFGLLKSRRDIGII